jgi:hypothetical protein
LVCIDVAEDQTSNELNLGCAKIGRRGNPSRVNLRVNKGEVSELRKKSLRLERANGAARDYAVR